MGLAAYRLVLVVLCLVVSWCSGYKILPTGRLLALKFIKQTKTVDVHDITHHPIRYTDGLGLQKSLADKMIAAQAECRDGGATIKVGDLLILQHYPVYTVGTGTKPTSGPFSEYDSKGERLDYETVTVDRAGDITYHGPGQIVLYPVIDLTYFGRDIHWYLRRLEQVVISAAAALGVQAGRIEQPGYTGVWVGGAKVAAIGLKVSRWVTTHGVSVNVDPDMRYFRNIVPCGISDADKRVGALREFNASLTVDAVRQALQEHFLLEMGVTAGSTRRGEEAAMYLHL